jgi:hypothetical protein
MGVYIERKVNSKNRRYNTVNNRQISPDDQAELLEKANAYQQVSNGE